MKVLVADKFEQSGIDGLKAAGCEVVYQPDLKDDALTAAIRDTGADVLVVRSTAVTAPMLEAGALSLVVRAGAGYNTIDVATASRRGIYVSNCPGKNAIAVAELAFALILALDRRIPDNVAELRAGTLEQEGVLEGARPVRPHARPARLRQHRPGNGAGAPTRSACRSSSGAGGSRPARSTSPTSRSRCSSRHRRPRSPSAATS